MKLGGDPSYLVRGSSCEPFGLSVFVPLFASLVRRELSGDNHLFSQDSMASDAGSTVPGSRASSFEPPDQDERYWTKMGQVIKKTTSDVLEEFKTSSAKTTSLSSSEQ